MSELVGPEVDAGGVPCVAPDGHSWRLSELRLSTAGADQGYVCGTCSAAVYVPAVAHDGDLRPGLDFTEDDLTAQERGEA